jgi:hypothetical protein
MISGIVGLADMDQQPGVVPERPADSATLQTLRGMLLAALVLGVAGTGTELLLLEHFEGWRQIVPIALAGCALIVIAWHGVDRGAGPLHALQALMLAFALSGVLGLVFHYRGNAEFEREMYPSMAGLELFREAMMGATPALAPGAMILLAIMGLAYTYRHPRLSSRGTGKTKADAMS